MKILVLQFSILLIFMVSCSKPVATTNYYFDASNGNDMNLGTSPDKAFMHLAKIQGLVLKPGDSVLLKAGETFNDSLFISCKGVPGKLIVLGKYGGEKRPHIQGNARVLQTVHVYNSEYFVIRDLEISNHDSVIHPHLTGLLVELNNFGTAHHVVIDNLFIHNVYGSLLKGDGYQHKDAGAGQAMLIKSLHGNETDSVASRFDSLLIRNCYIKDCQRNGIMLWGNWARKNWFPSQHVVICNNILDGVPGDGIVPVGCESPLVEYNVMKNCPSTLPPTEACDGIWPWSCDNALIQYNMVSDHKSKVDGYGFDSDYNCTNSVFQYNLSFNNDGGFLLLCNSGGWPTDWSVGNQGTIVRYNLSINDGIREQMVKDRYFSPVIHCTGPIKNSIIAHNLFYLIKKKNHKTDKTLISLTDWNGYPDSTSFRDNFIYSEEDYTGAITGKSTHTFLADNLFIGNLKKQDGFGPGQCLFNQQFWDSKNDTNWNKLIDFLKDKTVLINGESHKVTDLIGITN